MVAENLIAIGFVVVLIGFILIILGSILQTTKGKTEGGFIAFIGPIPIGWATSKNIFYILVILSLVVLIIFFILNRRLIP